MMDKITPSHLERSAYVYVRQSTAHQLTNNPESRRRQYALEPRARSLGWRNVTVIDDDLGRSGGGIARSGFERLLSAICSGSVGAVLAIEVSRLARNGRDWHTLIEFCGLVGSLIIDENGVYDPRSINDRLLLGMKGSFSELELSLLKQRSQEALLLKARRGDLHTIVAVGYVRSTDDRVEMDPDQRIRDAISRVFRTFDEVGSIRQATFRLQEDRVDLPHLVDASRDQVVEWRPARYHRVSALLTNPVYSGAYAFGRTSTATKIQDGRKVVRKKDLRRPEQWKILIPNHHEGYITWEQYERNQSVIAGNAYMKGAIVSGPARNGDAILVGLLRCGHCGRKLKVQYSGTAGVGRYVCSDRVNNAVALRTCISFGSMRIDAAVSTEFLRIISPLALTAALEAIAGHERTSLERLTQADLKLQQARYEADRARKQYDTVDPENRLVASELERRWNERLKEQAELEEELRGKQDASIPALNSSEKNKLLDLAHDLPRLWNHPHAQPATRKRLLRSLIEDIMVRVEPGRLLVKVHWKGGDHTAIEVPKNLTGQHRWKTSEATEQLVRSLARLLPDESIASLLNRTGIRSTKGNTWTLMRVQKFRSQTKIAVYRKGERIERGELILKEAALVLNVSKMTVIRLIKDGILPAKQACRGAPYVIQQADLKLAVVRRAIDGRRAAVIDPRQESLIATD